MTFAKKANSSGFFFVSIKIPEEKIQGKKFVRKMPMNYDGRSLKNFHRKPYKKHSRLREMLRDPLEHIKTHKSKAEMLTQKNFQQKSKKKNSGIERVWDVFEREGKVGVAAVVRLVHPRISWCPLLRLRFT